jgi:DNA-binding IclR family transcriptional regulator
LQTELRDIRARGYARSREAHENIHAIGVTLQVPPGSPRSAISVAWTDRRFPSGHEAELVEALRTIAQDISIELA